MYLQIFLNTRLATRRLGAANRYAPPQYDYLGGE